MIQIFAIENVPIFSNESELWKFFKLKMNILRENDILVCAHTPFSRTLGPLYELKNVIPSEEAISLGEELEKDPRHVQIIINESKQIVKFGKRVLITENFAGVVCANGGVDQSNAGLGKAVGVPHDPDNLAKRIKDLIKIKTGKSIAVIISDTVGRALRIGAVNIAIGVAGIHPMKSEIGKKDLFGYEMRVSEISVADELASAAELIQGQTNEGKPFVVIRGYNFSPDENVTAKFLNRPTEERIFR